LAKQSLARRAGAQAGQIRSPRGRPGGLSGRARSRGPSPHAVLPLLSPALSSATKSSSVTSTPLSPERQYNHLRPTVRIVHSGVRTRQGPVHHARDGSSREGRRERKGSVPTCRSSFSWSRTSGRYEATRSTATTTCRNRLRLHSAPNHPHRHRCSLTSTRASTFANRRGKRPRRGCEDSPRSRSPCARWVEPRGEEVTSTPLSPERQYNHLRPTVRIVHSDGDDNDQSRGGGQLEETVLVNETARKAPQDGGGKPCRSLVGVGA
jgi:hypothetical protein